MNFGEKLRALRTQKGYTLKQMEKITGITQSYLSKLERNEKTNPSIDTLTSLANFFGVEVQWLIQDNDDTDNSSPLTSKKIKQEITELLEIVNPNDLPKILAIIRVFIGKDNSQQTSK